LKIEYGLIFDYIPRIFMLFKLSLFLWIKIQGSQINWIEKFYQFGQFSNDKKKN